MKRVEDDQCENHRQRVEQVLVDFMAVDLGIDLAATVTREFDDAKDDSELSCRQHLTQRSQQPTRFTHRDQRQGSIESPEQFLRIRCLLRVALTRQSALEGHRKHDEDKDEELLQHYACCVDVQSHIDRLGIVRSRDGRTRELNEECPCRRQRPYSIIESHSRYVHNVGANEHDCDSSRRDSQQLAIRHAIVD